MSLRTIAVVAAAAVLVAIVVALVRTRQRRRSRPASAQPTPEPRTLANIRPGDLIGGIFDLTGGGDKRTVTGIIHCEENGYRWRELFVQAGPGVRQYVSVEPNGRDWTVTLWNSILPPQDAIPEADFTDDNGVSYVRRESGRAHYTIEGEADELPPTGYVVYTDYQGSDDSRMSCESFNGASFEWSRGELQNADLLTVYPASD